MDSNKMESLLEKYWNCETSLEEEKQLKELFAKGNIPSSMHQTSELFAYFEQQRNKPLVDEDFDSATLKKIKAISPEGRVVNMFNNVAKIAAGIVVLVAASYLVMKEVRKSYPAEVADTYSDPKLALEETKKALMLISKGFGKAQKEASKIELFNEAEKVIQGKPKEDSKLNM
jgi:hypothetical protein